MKKCYLCCPNKASRDADKQIWILLVGYMGAGQRHSTCHARLLRPQPQPHQRPLRAAIRPDDTGGTLRLRQHRRRKLSTSKETEMRLTDVARASLAELANDYINWLMRYENVPWSVKSEEHKSVSNIPLDRPTYKDDVQHLSSIHILKQKHKFDTWLCSKDPIKEANCLLVLCNRLIMMLSKQIENQLESFKEEGGFSEALSAERLAYRAEQSAQEDAPLCPKCGKPMIKRMAKKGKNAGNAFWSCSSYPNCDGTRSI